MPKDSSWTVEDVIRQTSIRGTVFSKDGNAVAWTKSRPSKKKDRFVTDLYLTRLNQEKDGEYRVVQLTRSEDSDRNPLFSADGETLYFLSSRKNGNHLWGISLFGGEAFSVDSFPQGISNLSWQNDSTLIYVASEGKSLREKQLKKKKDNVVVVEDQEHFKATRIFAFQLGTKERKRLTDNKFPIRSYAISKNGKWLVSSHILSPHYGSDGQPAPTYYLWDLENGGKTQILQSGYQEPGQFAFSQDNKGFYFSSVQSSDPEWNGAGISLLHYFDISTQSISAVNLLWKWGMAGGYQVRGQDVIVSLAAGTARKLAMYQKNGNNWIRQAIDAGSMNKHISVTALSEDGNKIAYSYSTASLPTQYRIGDFSQQSDSWTISSGKQLAKINAHLDKKRKAKTEAISWKGALNEEITGMLYYPHNYEAGKRYPLMVAIHGGPTGVDMDRWSDRWAYYHNLLSQRGCFILKPNYHGSGNHGQAFMESIKKHYYEYEVPDIVAGIGHLVDEGLVNRDSLAVMGWSNGAILATMLTVQYPDMFLAAAPGAGDVNWSSDFGTCRFGVTFDQSYFGGAPWDNSQGRTFNLAYIEKSPLFEMERVKTPTLICHGSEDRSVPRDQGWEYYRALQQIGQAAVKFLWFPGQPHGLQKLTHQRRKVTEELRWFDIHFFGTAKPINEATKKGSPLLALLEKEKSPLQDGLYGEMHQKTLLPEFVVVHKDSIAISRFEITHAQFQQFRQTHRYSPPHANHPVSGLSLADALAFAQWLGEQTGDTYRLPNASEAKVLHKKARKVAPKENTLHYWAGYEPTLDEVPMLREKLSEVTGSLLMEGGSFPATSLGESKIYDLGGNVAEWYEENGSSGVYGYGAGDFCDPASEAAPTQSKQLGFRIVKVL
ncbi:MAG: prolyl oligopeptidase family serine peptidase [Bacteroidota bacterium]